MKCVRRENGVVDYFDALLQDIAARERDEGALARSNAELERCVAERTGQLTAANAELKTKETALLRYRQELQALRARLIELQEQGGQHLARELHDAFSHRLAARV